MTGKSPPDRSRNLLVCEDNGVIGTSWLEPGLVSPGLCCEATLREASDRTCLLIVVDVLRSKQPSAPLTFTNVNGWLTDSNTLGAVHDCFSGLVCDDSCTIREGKNEEYNLVSVSAVIVGACL